MLVMWVYGISDKEKQKSKCIMQTPNKNMFLNFMGMLLKDIHLFSSQEREYKAIFQIHIHLCDGCSCEQLTSFLPWQLLIQQFYLPGRPWLCRDASETGMADFSKTVEFSAFSLLSFQISVWNNFLLQLSHKALAHTMHLPTILSFQNKFLLTYLTSKLLPSWWGTGHEHEIFG